VGFFELFATVLSGFYALIKSYGLAIILLTLLVRVLLLPLSIKQTKSMREMQVIQPEVKRLQAKHKGDRQKLNEEMMKLYKEHGVNPFGGCLPLLMQFPVLIGLFYVIRNPLAYLDAGTALAGDLVEKALSVHQFIGLRLDCSSQTAIQGRVSEAVPVTCGDGIVSALPYLLLVVGMGATTWYQQKQMQASRDSSVADSPQAKQMQMFGRIMPVMLMFFAFSFPSGVVLYWLTTNVWTIVQQRIILKAHPIPTLNGAGAAKGKGTTTTSTKAVKSDAIETTATPTEDVVVDGKPVSSKPHPSSKKKKKRK
jgi:YidC/Oxa1 family membrane protein insertase